MVLHSLKPCIQLAKAIASANLRTLEAISVLTESDALYLGSLLVLIDKLQANTSFCKFILELLPTLRPSSLSQRTNQSRRKRRNAEEALAFDASYKPFKQQK